MSDKNLKGTVLHGRYRIEDRLGEGGMSSVYRATHLTLNRPVAIKVIRDNLVQDATVRARFEREARAAARLTHPNIVHIHDFGTFEDGVFIAMEYIEGISLRDLILQRGKIDLEMAFDIIQQACAAVEAAHTGGILHRDIKPENLMIYEDEIGQRRVKVVDFGLAKLVSNEHSQELTDKTEMVGTPKYMAPERTTGDPVDGRADVYALAIVMFEMLTGRAPFDGTFREVIGKHLFEEPPSLASFGAEVPKRIEGIIHQGMAKEPDARIPSARELARQLAEACGVSISAVDWAIDADADPLDALDDSLFADDEAPTVGPESNLVDTETRVRRRAPTLFMPNPASASFRSDPTPHGEPAVPSMHETLSRVPAIGTIAVVAILGLISVAGLTGVLLWSTVAAWNESSATSPDRPGDVARATEPSAPVGQVTLPEDEQVKVVLEMDSSKIKTGAVLEISGPEFATTESFPLLRSGPNGLWGVQESARSRPGGLTLDEIMQPGRTLGLVVRNRDGSRFLPRIRVE